VMDTLLERVGCWGGRGLRRWRGNGCRRRYWCGCCGRGRTWHWCRRRCRDWRGCRRRQRWLPMALAKQKSRDAEGGGLGALPQTGSHRLSEGSFHCAWARREFWLSLLKGSSFSNGRVIGIRHIDRNFRSLPRTGNRIGKASSSRETLFWMTFPESRHSTNTRIFRLAKIRLCPIVHVRDRKHP
jgi:hypothetical protein